MRYWLLVLLLCQLVTWPVEANCLANLADSHRKNYFDYSNGSSVLTIESSERTTHNVTSHILYIFIKEVLGYDAVEVVYHDPFNSTSALLRLSKYETEPDQILIEPTTMINMEVWEEPTLSFSWRNEVVEVGKTVNTLGRFGWFVRDRENVSWESLKNIPNSWLHGLNGTELEYVMKNSIDVKCSRRKCDGGSFTPDSCYPHAASCITLLTGTYSQASEEVMDQIEAHDLKVRLVWLGQNLTRVLESLPRSRQVVLTWAPGEITTDETWHPIIFPPCLMDEKSLGCFYESRRIVKLISTKVEIGAKDVYFAATDMSFALEDYMHFIRDTIEHPEKSHYDVACNWMQSHSLKWLSWKYSVDKPVLTICGIFPLSGSLFSAEGIPVASNMAVAAVNRNNQILPHHDLRLNIQNGECNADTVMARFVDYILSSETKNFVGILGPACSETVEPLVGLTKYFHTVVISYSAEGSVFSNREQYPYFFRTIGENQQYIQVYKKLLDRLGWKRIAALTEDGHKYTEYLAHLQDLLQAHNLTFIIHRKFPRNRANATMRTYLEDLISPYRRARIIVADVHDSAARSVMCEAYHLQMTAAEGYVWFLPQWLSSNWYDTDSNKTRSKEEKVDCTTAEMLKAIQGYFSLAQEYFAPDHHMTHENVTVGHWKKGYQRLLNNTGKKWSNYAGYAYDAVWVYALALDHFYKSEESYSGDLHSKSAATKFADFIQKTDFMGVSGRIQFHTGPSRTTNINIMQWRDRNFTHVGSAIPVFSNNSRALDYHLDLDEKKIVWMTKVKPGDGEEKSTCVFQGLAVLLNLDCGAAIIVANVIGFGLLAVVLVVIVAFTKYRYDKRVELLESAEKYIKAMGIDLPPNLSECDKWEIPRDCVVINRRLGEGAFGTVYGGEAYFQDEGWVAAAVKTLKANSATEQKLDFLSEAEVMKRFDHKNIVKLLGVCTRDEPVYTVMEFMLYGDLKTFLLNRRHLVSGRRLADESNEVSNKKLTSMALDIARGLSYLSSLSFVHRDMACRNCLLNSARVAKIGDFGLTRRMYESDYYKFSRKGMLPIRWMAPESLADGIFTSKSDVWSFGVVLYEMVTFGSYPFQGLSNNQVVDHVKEGNTIPIPKTIKPQLECLIKSCWNLDYKKRPEPSEIVVFLASNPRLLSPCLDTPSSSVAVEDELREGRPSVPASPFDPSCNFFPGENTLELGDNGSPPASPTDQDPPSMFPDCARERLLPSSKPIHIAMNRLAPLASRTPSDTELSSGNL